MRLLAFLLLIGCSSAPYKDPTNLDLIESIANDPTIEESAKSKIIAKIAKKDIDTVRQIVTENTELKEQIIEDQWKVDLVNRVKTTFYWLLGILFACTVGYVLFKFRRLLGSPI